MGGIVIEHFWKAKNTSKISKEMVLEMQNVRHFAQNAGHTALNDGHMTHNLRHNMHNVCRNTLNVCKGPRGGLGHHPETPTPTHETNLIIIFWTLGT